MSTILITGGTGLIGRALTKALMEKGDEVIILTREPHTIAGKWPGTKQPGFATWNIGQQSIDQDAISKADHIIHLAGAAVAEKRWTTKRKQEIVDSRVLGGRLIVESLQKIPNKVKTVISSSGIGWYGPDVIQSTVKPFTENDPVYEDFLGITCRQWEESVQFAEGLNKRVVIFRTGMVLSKEGGAEKELIKPMRFGIATVLGTGRQIVSWIHISDLVNIYIKAIEDTAISGVYNAVAPQPVSNKELIYQLARSRMKFFIPVRVPSFVLKTILGELSIELLKSATVSAKKIQETGFTFMYPSIDVALPAK